MENISQFRISRHVKNIGLAMALVSQATWSSETCWECFISISAGVTRVWMDFHCRWSFCFRFSFFQQSRQDWMAFSDTLSWFFLSSEMWSWRNPSQNMRNCSKLYVYAVRVLQLKPFEGSLALSSKSSLKNLLYTLSLSRRMERVQFRPPTLDEMRSRWCVTYWIDFSDFDPPWTDPRCFAHAFNRAISVDEGW